MNNIKATFSNISENCIFVRIYDRQYGKSDRFFIDKSDMDDILYGKKEKIVRDMSSYCSIRRFKNKIKFEFDWLQKSGVNEIKGYTQYFIINADELEKWYISAKYNREIKDYTCLNIDNGKTPKFVIKDDTNLKYVIENPTLRKKFTKGIQRLMCFQSDTINLYNDWNKDSFYWEEYNNGQRGIVGGLIFHHDYENKEDLTKGYYSIHT